MNEFEEKMPEMQEETAESSVFSDPASHKATRKNSALTLIISAVALVLALAVFLTGIITYDKSNNTVFGFLKLPDIKKTSSDVQNKKPQITVVNESVSNMSVVTVTNKNGNFNLYYKLSEEKDEDGSKTKIWCVEGLDSSLTSSTAIEYIVKNSSAISAFRTVSGRSDKDCGFDKPVAKIDVVMSEGKGGYSITIGSDSPDKTGTYLKISGKDDAYIVSKEYSEYFAFTLLDLADTSAISGVKYDAAAATYFDDDKALQSFDSITISYKRFNKDIVVAPNSNEEQKSVLPFVVTAPYNRYADNVDGIVNAFINGIQTVGAYSYDTSAESIKKVGLDDPDATLTLRAGKITKSYAFSFMGEGYAAIVDSDKNMIKMIRLDSNSYLEYKEEAFYSDWLCMEMMSQLSSIEAKMGDTTYKFGITYDSEQHENTDKFTIVRDNGTTINTALFQDFYTFVLGIKINDFSTNTITKSPDAEITLTYSSDYSTRKYAFYKVSDTKYQYSINGVMQGKISATNYNKLIKNFALIAENKKTVP